MFNGIERPTFAVIGAGNGGMAMAGHLALKGFKVNLYNRPGTKLEEIKAAGGVHVSGVVDGFGKLNLVTGVMSEAISGSDVIMVTTPASAHSEIARLMGPHLDQDQIIVLNPGRTGGSLEFYQTIKWFGASNTVAEAQTFIYASRITGPASAKIFKMKRELPVAAFPGRQTRKVVWTLRQAFPQVVAARSVLHTGFDNIGAVFHPAPLLLNAGKVESGIEFDYYHEGITPSIAQVMEQVDAERLSVADALGVRATSAIKWLNMAYGAKGRTLHEAILNNKAYAGIKAPTTLRHRYISEDVPTGLVTISSFGKLAGVDTPNIDSLIQLATGIHGVDYWAAGRTVEKLGLAELPVEHIREYVETGIMPDIRRKAKRRWTASFVPAPIVSRVESGANEEFEPELDETSSVVPS